jgi:hypothetical protein
MSTIQNTISNEGTPAMAILSEAARKLLDSGPLAHVVTLNKDGSPT